jgi:hypothetical protein
MIHPIHAMAYCPQPGPLYAGGMRRKLDSDLVRPVVGSMARLSNLRELSLSNSFTPSTLVDVADHALEKLTALRSLDILDYEAQDMGGAWRLGQKLARLPYLLHLHLRPTPRCWHAREQMTCAFPPYMQVLSCPVIPSDDEDDM